MTDATQVNIPPVQPDPSAVPSQNLNADASGAAAANSDQSPLDILDQILKDAQSKATDAASEKLAEDEKKREEARERQRQLDQQKVQEELAQISEMKNSPQYQAMQDQKKEAVEQQHEHQQQMTGMEIKQLEHSKI